MKNHIFIVILLFPMTSAAFNLVGGKYSNTGDGAVARVRGATAAWINPAGLAFEDASSISSGASAYKYMFNNDNDKKSFSLSSSTSHVAAIRESESYVYGFMLYTSFDQIAVTKSSSYSKNSEGYLQGSSSYSKTDINQNFYMFSISPKKSTWGASINIIQTTVNVLSRDNSQNYSATPTSRKHKASTLELEDQFFMAGLEFGQQLKITEKLKFGYKLSSPTYLLQGGGYFRLDSVEVTGTDANNTTVYQANYDVETKTIDYYSSERLRVGLAFYLDEYIFEFDISYSGGYRRKKQKLLDKGDYLIWDSATDTYYLVSPEVEVGSDESDHNAANVTFSMEYTISDTENYGFSIGYAPTSERGGKGMNQVSLTSGYSKKYKNFLGSYGLHYLKGIDTGNNTITDEVTNSTEKVIQEFESISLMVSGTYYF